MTPEEKRPEDWPCHCCSCTHTADVGITDVDPRCHVHGTHGQRGCAKHGVDPARCACGNCPPVDHDLEQDRHADYLLRAEQHEHRERFAGSVPINTENTAEGLAALRASRAKAAAQQADAQQAALRDAVRAVMAQGPAQGGD